MIVRERMEGGRWSPPWLYYQHVARYEWAARTFAASTALDAAAGTGYGSKELATTSGKVVSLDIELGALAEGKQSSRDLRALAGDTTRLPFRDATFDTFVSFETIEHVPDDGQYVREARRVTRRAGVFVCSTPNRRVVNPGNTIADPPFNRFHVREYDTHELQTLLKGAFSDVTMLGQSGFASSYVHLLGLIGRTWRMGGVRMHQARKLLTLPFEKRERHEPRVIGAGEEPEVLIAICR
jgi:SAM-dependent methyltransferase